jgi:hypothetical protein
MNAPPAKDPFADCGSVEGTPPPDMLINPAEIEIKHVEEKHSSAEDIVNMFGTPAPAAAAPAAAAAVEGHKDDNQHLVDAKLNPSDLSMLDAVATHPADGAEAK